MKVKRNVVEDNYSGAHRQDVRLSTGTAQGRSLTSWVMSENLTRRVEDHDLGLSHDLPRIVERSGMGRRGLLALFGGVGAAAVAGCASDDPTRRPRAARRPPSQDAGGPGQPPSGGGDSNVSVADGRDPRGDGRSLSRATDPTVPTYSARAASSAATSPRSFGSASGTAEGVPLTIRMKVYDLNGDDATILDGAAVYAWHCDREGRYSMYDSEIADENYLRGVQEADDDGLGRVHEHLPGGVRRSLAARPLRGLPEPGRRDQRRQQAAHLAAGAARGRLHGGLRDRRLRGQRRQPGPHLTGLATWCSATATRCSWPR